MTSGAQAQVTIGEFQISDSTTETSQPVSGATLSVSGNYQWDSPEQPTRVVLRLKGKANADAFNPLDAVELDPSQSSGEYNLSGNVLDIEGVTAADLTPDEVGQTTETTITAKVLMEVYRDGTELATHSVEDTATIAVEKTEVQVDVQIGGSGGITVHTSD